MVKNSGTEFLRTLVHELFQPFYDIEYEKDFKEDSVCKWQLVSPFGCPHLLFPNARSDLGPCSKKHDIRLKQKYDQETDHSKYPYEQWFFNYLQRLILHLDRKIKKHQSRLHGYSADIDEENDERWEKIIELDEKINEMIAKSEEYGLNGMVEESYTLATQIDQLQLDLEQLKNSTSKSDDKSFDVCPVCSALLIVNDTTNRTGIHIDGKQHQGYQKIRDHFNYLQQNRPDLVEESVKQYQRQQQQQQGNRRFDNREPAKPPITQRAPPQNSNREGRNGPSNNFNRAPPNREYSRPPANRDYNRSVPARDRLNFVENRDKPQQGYQRDRTPYPNNRDYNRGNTRPRGGGRGNYRRESRGRPY